MRKDHLDRCFVELCEQSLGENIGKFSTGLMNLDLLYLLPEVDMIGVIVS